ncbi:hypothetical protein DFJ77DRAFT_550446 [Powellomyces hirtus]|nr:hypothetical protein DFJ77DRAFT_550446 [Powellomyces hirtus]
MQHILQVGVNIAWRGGRLFELLQTHFRPFKHGKQQQILLGSPLRYHDGPGQTGFGSSTLPYREALKCQESDGGYYLQADSAAAAAAASISLGVEDGVEISELGLNDLRDTFHAAVAELGAAKRTLDDMLGGTAAPAPSKTGNDILVNPHLTWHDIIVTPNLLLECVGNAIPKDHYTLPRQCPLDERSRPSIESIEYWEQPLKFRRTGSPGRAEYNPRSGRGGPDTYAGRPQSTSHRFAPYAGRPGTPYKADRNSNWRARLDMASSHSSVSAAAGLIDRVDPMTVVSEAESTPAACLPFFVFANPASNYAVTKDEVAAVMDRSALIGRMIAKLGTTSEPDGVPCRNRSSSLRLHSPNRPQAFSFISTTLLTPPLFTRPIRHIHLLTVPFGSSLASVAVRKLEICMSPLISSPVSPTEGLSDDNMEDDLDEYED